MQNSSDETCNKASPERWKFIASRANSGNAAARDLITALKDTDKWVRFAAAEALGNLGDPQNAGPLIAALEDTDQDVRFIIAEALGKLGDPKARIPLRCLYARDRSYARIAAGMALSRLGAVEHC